MAVPTTRKRHTLTETDPVQQALAPLRAQGHAVDLGELVVLGAQSKLAELDRARHDEAHRRQLREQFLELAAGGPTFDLDAALEVRERGWARG